MDKEITVHVIYATATEYWCKTLRVSAPLTVEAAIGASGVLQAFPDIDWQINKVGVFGELVSLAHEVLENDRIEIYRPLPHDPMMLRKQRALIQKKKKAQGGKAN